MGLGDFNKVPLAKAREAARAARELLGDLTDPLEHRRQPDVPTFGERADAYIKAHKPGWKNAKHIEQWEMTMREYAKPIRGKRVDLITTADVFAILEPIWLAKHAMSAKTRQRIEIILDSAKSLGHFKGDNPASKKILNPLLPKAPEGETHHTALSVEDMPAFIEKLRARRNISALALEFTDLDGGANQRSHLVGEVGGIRRSWLARSCGPHEDRHGASCAALQSGAGNPQ